VLAAIGEFGRSMNAAICNYVLIKVLNGTTNTLSSGAAPSTEKVDKNPKNSIPPEKGKLHVNLWLRLMGFRRVNVNIPGE
jgi:hypothetical protein